MDYIALLAQLLPPGLALSPEQNDTADLLGKTAAELQAVARLDEVLLREVDPRNSILLLMKSKIAWGYLTVVLWVASRKQSGR